MQAKTDISKQLADNRHYLITTGESQKIDFIIALKGLHCKRHNTQTEKAND